MKIINLDIECKSCGGTGVYIGFGENGGASVVCSTCKGTGCQNYEFKYTPFTKRKVRENVKRVFITGYGYGLGVKPITLDNGTFVDFSKEGVSYEDFLKGKMPKHIKQMGCPMSADQSACHNIKGFTAECHTLNDGWVNYILGCKCKNKMKCWDRFEIK